MFLRMFTILDAMYGFIAAWKKVKLSTLKKIMNNLFPDSQRIRTYEFFWRIITISIICSVYFKFFFLLLWFFRYVLFKLYFEGLFVRCNVIAIVATNFVDSSRIVWTNHFFFSFNDLFRLLLVVKVMYLFLVLVFNSDSNIIY